MYKKGALIGRSAFSTSPPNPGVPPTSCFSHVRICRIKLFASASGIKFVRYSCKTCSNVVSGLAPPAPQLPPPPLLRIEPRCPHHRERLQSFRWLRCVIPILESRVCGQRGNLPFQSDHS